MQMRWSDPSPLSGLALAALCAGLVFALGYGLFLKGERRRTVLTGVVFGTVGFQVFHVFEHGLQLGYWALHPTEKPWLTPWAQTGVDGLSYWCSIWPGKGAAGARGGEMLHLVGNGIFMAGVVAMLALAMAAGIRSSTVRGTLIFQGFHLLEHSVLTATLFISGSAWGASTMFGRWSGSELSGHRVWWHFTVNAIATVLGLMALRSLYRAGALSVRPALTSVARAATRLRLVGWTVAGMVGLQVLPAVVGSIAGDPAPRVATRNAAFPNPLDPGTWWPLFAPSVLIPLMSIVTMVVWMRRAQQVPVGEPAN